MVSAADRVAVVGVGDDGPASLSPRACAAVEGAEILFGGRRHLALFPEHPAERVAIGADLDRLVDRLRDVVGRRRAVVLATGDPERVEIIPNVGAVSLAFARLGVGWHDATVVSAHGRHLPNAVRQARGARKLAVLTDDRNTPAVVAQALLDAGAVDGPAWVFEHLGGPNERQLGGTLGELADRAFAALNVLVIPELRWPPADQSFGRPEEEFCHREGLITKAEVRAVSLSKLRLAPDDTLWDVGAGCGSVSVEAAGLLPRGYVLAVERSPQQLELLRRNVARSGRLEAIRIVAGEAPVVLEGLPAPNAVFVGGSGGSLEPILDACFAVLRSRGRLVVNLSTLEHLQTCTAWGRARNAPGEIVQVSISRGVPILDLTRLEALNPVFVVTFERP
jgi:precorrin-6Y C5,15-methyltransferase (decarboxylating)